MNTASRDDVARLLGRVALGATQADLDRWAGKPYEAVVDHLLFVPKPDARAPEPDDGRRLALERGSVGPYFNGVDANVQQAQRWWLERMRTTKWPVEERLVLLWHDHFATSIRQPTPDLGMMLAQNQTVRRFALGSFRDLLAAMTVDAAMLHWLDGVTNAPPLPNENYARELFELFALGTAPTVYTEEDIREAARVLTGWTADTVTRIPMFNAGRHDKGRKTVLGQTITDAGSQEYLRLIAIVLAQPVAYRFVAWKLVNGLAYAVPAGAGDPLVDKVAETLKETTWNIAAAVRTLLLAGEFRSSPPSLVRQPVELVVAAAKALGISFEGNDTRIFDVLARMGQRPFFPPNVGGWPKGGGWVSPASTIARYDWGVLAYQLWNAVPAVARQGLPPAEKLDAWTARLGLGSLTPTTSAIIGDYLHTTARSPEPERQAGVLALLLSSPDWMVM